MSETLLSRDCLEFAKRVTELCFENDRGRLMKDQMIRAVQGMAYNTADAYRKSRSEKPSSLEKALSDARRAELWLELFEKSRILSEADINRLTRKCASLRYRISVAYKSSLEGAQRQMKRFTALKTAFSSSRLIFRSWRAGDIDPFLELCLEDSCSAYSFSCPPDRDSAIKLVKDNSRLSHFYAVSRPMDGDFAGFVGIYDDGAGGVRKRIEFGISKRFRGCGYASEIVSAAAEYAFKKCGAQAVSLYVTPENGFLVKTLCRIGFETEGVLSSFGKNGEDITVITKKTPV